MRISLKEKQTLLQDAALKVISSQGIDAATARAITAEANQNLASISYAFESKENLLVSLQQVLQKDVDAVVEKALVGCQSLEEAVEKVSLAYFKYTTKDPKKQRAHYELTLFALSKPEHRDIARKQYKQLIEASMISAASLLAKPMSNAELKVFSSLNLAIMDGVILQYLATGNRAAALNTLKLGIESLKNSLRD